VKYKPKNIISSQEINSYIQKGQGLSHDKNRKAEWQDTIKE